MRKSKKFFIFPFIFLVGFLGSFILGLFFVVLPQRKLQNQIDMKKQENFAQTSKFNDFLGSFNLYKDQTAWVQHLSNGGPICITPRFDGAASNDIIKSLPVAKNISKGLILDPEIQKYLNEGAEIFQVCVMDGSNLGFVLYGDFGKFNNVIGIYGESGVTVEAHQYNPPMGDIGLCYISGEIEGNLLYSCGGGDGPYGQNTLYILHTDSGKSSIIQHCSIDGTKSESEECSIDILELSNG